MNFKQWLKETEVVMGNSSKPKLPKKNTFNVWGAPGVNKTNVIEGEPVKSSKS